MRFHRPLPNEQGPTGTTGTQPTGNTTERDSGMTTATELWQARTAASIAVGHAHRQQADADRDLVERMAAEITALRREVADLKHDVDVLIEERDQAIYERDSARAVSGVE